MRSFIAMSVYRPHLLPPLKSAAGRRFYILHSPGDKVCPPRMAEQARDDLMKAGAAVKYATAPLSCAARGEADEPMGCEFSEFFRRDHCVKPGLRSSCRPFPVASLRAPSETAERAGSTCSSDPRACVSETTLIREGG